MDEFMALMQQIQERVALLEAENATLRKENESLRARLNVTKPVPEPLKVYDRVEDIVWERGPHTANSYMLQAWAGSKYDTRPWKQVIVKDVGQVYRMNHQIGTPDWYGIAHNRCLDVTANPWVCLVQDGDDGWEDDPSDMHKLVREYKGGLRYSLSTWNSNSLGKELKASYLETHDDPGIVDSSLPFDMAPVPRELRPER